MGEPEVLSEDRSERTSRNLALAGLVLLLANGLAANLFVDPDMWHEMALFREVLRVGYVPEEDVFAYTPTVNPSVHHEWGAGAILYSVATRWGGTGILLLKGLLVAGTAAAAFACARRRGASVAVLAPLAPLAIFQSLLGFTTIRAQVFTMLCVALLLLFLAQDRDGRRGWIALWFPTFLFWVNVHAGFVVGIAFFFAHVFEEMVRRRPVRHLLLVGAGFLPLVLVNPYGPRFVPYVWAAIRLERPLVTEWAPVWHTSPPLLFVFVLSVLVAAYGLLRNGLRGSPGVLIVLLSTYAAVRHQRHVSIHAVAWLAIVPAWIEGTLLGGILRDTWRRHRRVHRAVYGLLAAACLVGTLARRPWHLPLPANRGDHPKITYPVGAVQYLRETGFRGNVMVPFLTGAFVLWKLHPEVLVSIDGRFEVAYPPEALAETVAFYDAEPGWDEVLTRHATDLVLAPTWKPISEALERAGRWTIAYRDDAYMVFVRPGLEPAPTVDRRGQVLEGSFP